MALLALRASADGLSADSLGVVFNRNDPASTRVAEYYVSSRHIPAVNLIGLSVPDQLSIGRDQLKELRGALVDRLPATVQSLLLVWSRPYAVECMSVTTAFAAGYQPGFCEPGCGPTTVSPLFDSREWLPADTVGWLPAMLLPSDDETLARAVIDRGIRADGTQGDPQSDSGLAKLGTAKGVEPRGTVYLVRTQDRARGVRALEYADAETRLANRVPVRELTAPIAQPPGDIMGYFTGVIRVAELPGLLFLPGAVADHLTSTGGELASTRQMSALEWLKQGATASYGTVIEPCNLLGKFPNPGVLFDHYLRGDTVLEAYWKSVVMPGQGLFIGEPLARPYSSAH